MQSRFARRREAKQRQLDNCVGVARQMLKDSSEDHFPIFVSSEQHHDSINSLTWLPAGQPKLLPSEDLLRPFVALASASPSIDRGPLFRELEEAVRRRSSQKSSSTTSAPSSRKWCLTPEEQEERRRLRLEFHTFLRVERCFLQAGQTKEVFEKWKALNLLVREDEVVKTHNTGPVGQKFTLDWATVPACLDPLSEEHTALTKQGRGLRKRRQLQSLVEQCVPVIRNRLRLLSKTYDDAHEEHRVHIVDFCAGSGHVGLLLAWIFLGCPVRVTCVERCAGKHQMFQKRLQHLQEACADAILSCKTRFPLWELNCKFFEASLEEATFSFDVGTSLHSCGLLTDKTLQLCCHAGADFVLVPCCYGQLSGRESEINQKKLGLGGKGKMVSGTNRSPCPDTANQYCPVGSCWEGRK